MTSNVVIALSCGTNDTNRATRAIHLATIAHNSQMPSVPINRI
jgi:hypothetical protein